MIELPEAQNDALGLINRAKNYGIEAVDLAKIEALEAERDFKRIQATGARITAEAMNRDFRDALSTAGEHKIYSFYGDIDISSVVRCMDTLGRWSRQPEAKDDPFTIELSSPGGGVLEGLSLIDYIRKLQLEGKEINTEAYGFVASMGTALLQMGDKRTLGRNSYMMIHEVSMSGLGGSYTDLQDELKVLEKLNEKVLDLLADRSNLSRSYIEREWVRDWWMDAREAKENGFCDEII